MERLLLHLVASRFLSDANFTADTALNASTLPPSSGVGLSDEDENGTFAFSGNSTTKRPRPGGALSSDPTYEGNNGDGDDDTYEFVAFILWYIFLVLCCIVPTCFAYRRRRIMEARLAQQQATMSRLQQSNLFILSNLHRQLDNEQVMAARATAIAEELKGTTMTVTENDLSEGSSSFDKPPIPTAAACGADDSPDENATVTTSGTTVGTGTVRGDEESNEGNSGGLLTYDVEDIENAGLLNLPANAELKNARRTVPATCSICLCPYEVGDNVCWSPHTDCQHAFHKDCIVQWLSKKDQPNCPVCRQGFCESVSVEEEEQRQLQQEHVPGEELTLRFAGLPGMPDMMIPTAALTTGTATALRFHTTYNGSNTPARLPTTVMSSSMIGLGGVTLLSSRSGRGSGGVTVITSPRPSPPTESPPLSPPPPSRPARSEDPVTLEMGAVRTGNDSASATSSSESSTLPPVTQV